MKKLLNGKEITLGTCYYPEHWPESMWEEDLKRMLSVGIRTIRIGEFAWNKTEPEEGVYTYEFFDRFLALCEKCGMQVIFCTPTATAPAWLTEKYPEVLNRDVNGFLIHHGERQHTNYNSPVYQRFSEKITEVLASHYAKHPAIVGWQLDNEFNCGSRLYYSESDTIAFRKFLAEKYQDIAALNEAWGTNFWNQTYNSFEEIHVPRKTNGNSFNPHLLLDYDRFISASTIRFAKAQADIIRKYKKPDDFITTNGIFGNLDYTEMLTDCIDDLYYDSYPNFAYCLDSYDPDSMKDRKWSMNLAAVRSYCEPFGIMEQQSGANGWNTKMEAPTPRPGQMTLWTLQSIAHGADYVSYFRWRTCSYGTEMYWHGILDYSSRDNRRLREVGEIAEKVRKLSGVAGAKSAARVAVLQDFDNQLDETIDLWHARIAKCSEKGIFAALEKAHVPFDYCNVNDQTDAGKLAKYQAVFYPHPEILTEARAKMLENYVKNGGTVVFGARSGQKDIHGICTMDTLPGVLKPLTGADVKEYSFVAPDEGKVTVTMNGKTFEAACFNDLLDAKDGAEVIGRYDNSYYAGDGAVVRKAYGKGQAYYFGAAFSEDAAAAFLTELGLTDPYQNVLALPESLELAVREKEGKQYLFVLNYEKEPQQFTLKQPLTDLLAGETKSGETVIDKYGVCVFEL